jgi:hypothetical protein
MSQEYPIPRQDARSDDVATMEWGQDEPPRPGRRTDPLARLGRDARLVPVLAGIGAVAVFASLVGEWTIMTVPNVGADGGTTARAPGGVSDATNFGAAYLFGIFGVTCCLALILFGTPTVRRNVRVVGLAIAGVVLAILAAATLTLDDTSRLGLYGPDSGLRIDYGRGLMMAYVGTAILGLALYFAGRLGQPGPVPAGHPSVAPRDDPDHPDGETAAAFSWRRRPGTGAPDDDELDSAPRDLTVGPITPFAAPESPDGR